MSEVQQVAQQPENQVETVDEEDFLSGSKPAAACQLGEACESCQ